MRRLKVLLPTKKIFVSNVTGECAEAYVCPGCNRPLLETKPGEVACFNSTCKKKFLLPEVK